MDFFKLRNIAEEGGAGEDGTPELVAKYKNATPGQNTPAPTRQPARKGDMSKSEAMKKAFKEESDKLDLPVLDGEEMQAQEAIDSEQIDELKVSTLTRYGTKATQALGRDPEKEEKRIKGIQKARAKVQQKTMKKEADLDEGENKQMKGKDPCWKGYQMVGTKKKNGKEVPNCVPANEGVDLKEYPEDLKKMKKVDSYKVGDKVMVKAGGKWNPAVITKPKNARGNYSVRLTKSGIPYLASVDELRLVTEEIEEGVSYKVEVEGLPTMYIASKSPSEVKANLRKLLRKPDSINSVERVMDTDVRKAFRLKAQGKEEMEEGVMKNIKRQLTARDADSRAGEEATKMMKAQQAGDSAAATKHNNRYKKLVALTKKEGYTSDAQRKAVWASKNEKGIKEKLDPSMGAGEYVKDFEKSDAPQFKGKTKKERQKMAVAAYLAAKRGD